MVYLFGNGFTKSELTKVTGEAVIPEKYADSEPWYFRRAPVAGAIDGEGKANFNYMGSSWHDVVKGPFGWIPERIRSAKNDGIPGFDKYGTREDALAYMEALKKAQTTDPTIPMRNSVVAPAMDNRTCGGWGDSFKYLDREEGALYKALWDYNVENRNYLDVVYIATWNDYTEGTQIEPTVEDGYRELLTTQQSAYDFKGEGNLDSSGMHLPKQLFELRSEARRLEKIGYKTEAQQIFLDRAGLAISAGNYEEAAAILAEAQKQLNEYTVTTENITCSQSDNSFP